MRTRTIRLVTLSAVASLAIAGSAQARHGADDPVGHHKAKHHKKHHRHSAAHKRHGADDPAGHR
jgi:Spy/CpxP family protein refolding chaperone